MCQPPLGRSKAHETREIVDLLWNVLSDQLSDKQKENKVDNILRKLRAEQKIKNKTQGNKSIWSLVNL